jgi:hypothetical protein
VSKCERPVSNASVSLSGAVEEVSTEQVRAG